MLNSNERAGDWIANDLAFDIRAGHPGGEWPVKGVFRLRSFHSILYFLGHSMGDEPEYHVAPDPRTPAIANNENPDSTMELIISDSAPPRGELSIHSQGQYYTVTRRARLPGGTGTPFRCCISCFK